MFPTLTLVLVICLSVCRVDAYNFVSSTRIHRSTVLTMNSRPMSSRDTAIQDIRQKVSLLSATLLVVAPSIVLADQGSLTKSTVEQAKKAALHVKECMDGLQKMDALADKGDYQAIGDLLSSSSFQSFSDDATILTRSDLISAEDKVALGTIKRYGVVADYIIMAGGLAAELRAAGVKVAGGGGPANGAPIDEDAEEDGEDEVKKINAKEVKRYIKLSKDSLSDVYRIVGPILSK